MSDLQAGLSDWLQRAAPTFLVHPHGFYVVLLGRTAREEWRLHHWPAGKRATRGMPAFIHTHDCHVESRILVGQLTNVVYRISEVEQGGQPLYQVGYAGDRYAGATSNVLKNTGTRVQGAVEQSDVYHSGDCYHVERNVYHQACVSEQDATTTLVCMHERDKSPVMLVGLDGFRDDIEFKREEARALDFEGWF
ncbi:hypothetical protein LFL97_20780 [Burkholderia sp. JSH-S8]|nr:hypothetical protein LFL97_20780 [Burkholderia sp. JSH-S8]